MCSSANHENLSALHRCENFLDLGAGKIKEKEKYV
jgi:hypothetical protein